MTDFVTISEAFRNAETAADLQAAGKQHNPTVLPWKDSEDEREQGAYWALREAYKYYMRYLLGETPGDHPRIARQKAEASGECWPKLTPARAW